MSSSFFKTSKQFPVTETLSKLFSVKTAKVRERGTFKTHSRVDIVSPELCTDILKYLHADLSYLQGCDIIDINPGACVWSTKIHEAIQPRRHLLMEPEVKYFEPFIKPLLDQKNSRFRHTILHPTHPQRYWSSYEKIFNDELLPRRARLADDDPAFRKSSETLLLTGNLLRLYPFEGGKFDIVNYMNLLLGHLIQSAQTNTMFHSYGLVRMLLWIPEVSRRHILPEALHMRNTTSTSCHLVADILEVAGTDQGEDCDYARNTLLGRPRSKVLDELSSLRSIRRGQSQDMMIPKGRERVVFSDKAAKSLEKIYSNMTAQNESSSNEISNMLLKDVEAFQKDVKDFAFARTNTAVKAHKSDTAKSTAKTARYKPLSLYSPAELDDPVLFQQFIALSERQLILEKRLIKAKEDYDIIKTILMTTASMIREGLYGSDTAGPRMWAERYRGIFDEHRTFLIDEPPLSIDRQAYAPLQAAEDEFWPNIPSMLVDIKPLERNLASDIISASNGNTIQRGLIKGLMQRRTKSIDVALDEIVVESSVDLLETTPILRDSTRGGRLDPKDLKVNALTREMLHDLTVSYLEWPFRPTELDLFMDNSSNVIGDDSIDPET